MTKENFKKFLKNSDTLIFAAITLVAGSILTYELCTFSSLVQSIKESFLLDGIFAGLFASCGCLLPIIALVASAKWGVYDSWKKFNADK